jgi:hypothetical protein
MVKYLQIKSYPQRDAALRRTVVTIYCQLQKYLFNLFFLMAVFPIALTRSFSNYWGTSATLNLTTANNIKIGGLSHVSFYIS